MTPPILPEEAPAPLAEDLVPGEPIGIEAIRDSAEPALSDEREVDKTNASFEDDIELEGDFEDDLEVDPDDETTREALAALYGEDFPLLNTEPPEDDEWAQWAYNLWESHRSGVEQKLWLAERNRLFRRGIQWISAKSGGPWREPPKPKDAARVVDNMIGPALDQRVQLISEQRPGFKTRPATRDPNDLKRAEAQQLGLEYQYDQQGMAEVMREAAYWAQTDGVSFIETYWDADRGPWHEFPVSPEKDAPTVRRQLGDLASRVRKIEQVRVSADASATQSPWYWIIKEVIPLKQALREHGLHILEDASREVDLENKAVSDGLTRLGHAYPDTDALLRDQDVIERVTVYCKASEYLPNGMMLIIVGRKVAFRSPLLWGTVPMVRVTDGSADPSYFPIPIMDGWIDSQMRVNAILSKWVENVRLNAGPRLLGKANAIAGETLVGGTMSLIEVKGLGGINDNVRPIEGFSLAPDAKELLEREKIAFENLSGWNDTSRGQFSADTSGRAILAIREQLERIFAPPIGAAARAMVDWAKASIAGMRWGYEVPRMIGMVGSGRPDLARELQAEDFDGTVDVWVDPETMMPMPRALRLFLLDNMLAQGLMTPQEYRRRSPFAWVGSITTEDDDQEARARRCAEALRNGQMLPVLWQDNEAIHQDVLERELILPDDTPPPIRMAAQQRWLMLAQQAMMKMGNVPPQMQQGGGDTNEGVKPGEGVSGSTPNSPVSGTNAGMPQPPTAGSATDQSRTARQFENKFQPQ